MDTLTLDGPYESRKASQNLRDQLISHLQEADLPPGSPFYSDAALVNMSGLSRKTVRKALTDLQRGGWIERHPGKGSFVGPRVGVPIAPGRVAASPRRRVIRLAVLVYYMDGKLPDWYSQRVLAGVDQSAIDEGISIELLGNYTLDINALSMRLTQSRPDALLVIPATSRHAYMAGEAQRLKIPCLLTGTRLMDLDLPTVAEDNEQGAALAVRHLYEKGHRRIGLLQRADLAQWVFERRRGYLRGLRDVGLDVDERLLWWQEGSDEQAAADLKAYLEARQPTAVIATSARAAWPLGLLVGSGQLRIPEDLSFVTFDQCYPEYQSRLGTKPTTIDLPLEPMGKAIGELARKILDGEDSPRVVRLPCSLTEGQTVTERDKR